VSGISEKEWEDEDVQLRRFRECDVGKGKEVKEKEAKSSSGFMSVANIDSPTVPAVC